MTQTGYIIPGGLAALQTDGGWIIVHGQPTEHFSEPVRLSSATELEKWLRPDHLRLHAGEMTAQELRTVQAVVRAMIATRL